MRNISHKKLANEFAKGVVLGRAQSNDHLTDLEKIILEGALIKQIKYDGFDPFHVALIAGFYKAIGLNSHAMTGWRNAVYLMNLPKY